MKRQAEQLRRVQRKEFEQPVRESDARQIEVRAMRADGTEFLVELAITPPMLGGSPIFATSQNVGTAN